MKQLTKMSRQQLQDEYFINFGSFPATTRRNTLLAALYHGKQINYLTEEEINEISEL